MSNILGTILSKGIYLDNRKYELNIKLHKKFLKSIGAETGLAQG